MLKFPKSSKKSEKNHINLLKSPYVRTKNFAEYYMTAANELGIEIIKELENKLSRHAESQLAFILVYKFQRITNRNLKNKNILACYKKVIVDFFELTRAFKLLFRLARQTNHQNLLEFCLLNFATFALLCLNMGINDENVSYLFLIVKEIYFKNVEFSVLKCENSDNINMTIMSIILSLGDYLNNKILLQEKNKADAKHSKNNITEDLQLKFKENIQSSICWFKHLFNLIKQKFTTCEIYTDYIDDIIEGFTAEPNNSSYIHLDIIIGTLNLLTKKKINQNIQYIVSKENQEDISQDIQDIISQDNQNNINNNNSNNIVISNNPLKNIYLLNLFTNKLQKNVNDIFCLKQKGLKLSDIVLCYTIEDFSMGQNILNSEFYKYLVEFKENVNLEERIRRFTQSGIIVEEIDLEKLKLENENQMSTYSNLISKSKKENNVTTYFTILKGSDVPLFMEKVSADGNCLFHSAKVAISYYFHNQKMHKIHNIHHLALRNEVIDHISRIIAKARNNSSASNSQSVAQDDEMEMATMYLISIKSSLQEKIENFEIFGFGDGDFQKKLTYLSLNLHLAKATQDRNKILLAERKVDEFLDDPKTIDAFLATKRLNGVWGDEIDICTINKLYGINLVVYNGIFNESTKCYETSGISNGTLPENAKPVPIILLSNHYNVVLTERIVRDNYNVEENFHSYINNYNNKLNITPTNKNQKKSEGLTIFRARLKDEDKYKDSINKSIKSTNVVDENKYSKLSDKSSKKSNKNKNDKLDKKQNKNDQKKKITQVNLPKQNSNELKDTNSENTNKDGEKNKIPSLTSNKPIMKKSNVSEKKLDDKSGKKFKTHDFKPEHKEDDNIEDILLPVVDQDLKTLEICVRGLPGTDEPVYPCRTENIYVSICEVTPLNRKILFNKSFSFGTEHILDLPELQNMLLKITEGGGICFEGKVLRNYNYKIVCDYCVFFKTIFAAKGNIFVHSGDHIGNYKEIWADGDIYLKAVNICNSPANDNEFAKIGSNQKIKIDCISLRNIRGIIKSYFSKIEIKVGVSLENYDHSSINSKKSILDISGDAICSDQTSKLKGKKAFIVNSKKLSCSHQLNAEVVKLNVTERIILVKSVIAQQKLKIIFAGNNINYHYNHLCSYGKMNICHTTSNLKITDIMEAKRLVKLKALTIENNSKIYSFKDKVILEAIYNPNLASSNSEQLMVNYGNDNFADNYGTNQCADNPVINQYTIINKGEIGAHKGINFIGNGYHHQGSLFSFVYKKAMNPKVVASERKHYRHIFAQKNAPSMLENKYELFRDNASLTLDVKHLYLSCKLYTKNIFEYDFESFVQDVGANFIGQKKIIINILGNDCVINAPIVSEQKILVRQLSVLSKFFLKSIFHSNSDEGVELILNNFDSTEESKIICPKGKASIKSDVLNSKCRIKSKKSICLDANELDISNKLFSQENIILKANTSFKYLDDLFFAAGWLDITTDVFFDFYKKLINPIGSLKFTMPPNIPTNEEPPVKKLITQVIQAKKNILLDMPIVELIVGEKNNLVNIQALEGVNIICAYKLNSKWGKILALLDVDISLVEDLDLGDFVTYQKTLTLPSPYCLYPHYPKQIVLAKANNGACIVSGKNIIIKGINFNFTYANIHCGGNFESDFDNYNLESASMFISKNAKISGNILNIIQKVMTRPMMYKEIDYSRVFPNNNCLMEEFMLDFVQGEQSNITIGMDFIYDLNKLNNYAGQISFGGKLIQLSNNNGTQNSNFLNQPPSTCNFYEVNLEFRFSREIRKIFTQLEGAPRTLLTDNFSVQTSEILKPTFSGGQEIDLKNVLNIFEGNLASPNIKIQDFELVRFGADEQLVFLPKIAPFKQKCSLIKLAKPSGLYSITTKDEHPFVFKFVLPISSTVNFPRPVVIKSGYFSFNDDNLRLFMSPAQESELAVKSLIKMIGRGYLDKDTTTPLQILFRLRQNAVDFKTEYENRTNRTNNSGNTNSNNHISNNRELALRTMNNLPNATKPMILFTEEVFENNGERETVLSSNVWVPKSYDNPKARCTAGFVYANNLITRGKIDNSLLKITSAVHVNDLIDFSATDGHFIKRQAVEKRMLRNVSTKKSMFGFSRKEESTNIELEIRTSEQYSCDIYGGTISEDFKNIYRQGANISSGIGGFESKGHDKVIMKPNIDTTINTTEGSSRSLFTKQTCIIHREVPTIIPTTFTSLAHIESHSDNLQELECVKVKSLGPALFTAKNLHLIPVIVKEVKDLKCTSKLFKQSIETGTIEKASPTIIMSADTVTLRSNNEEVGSIHDTASVLSGDNGVKVISPSVEILTQVLKETSSISGDGLKGFKYSILDTKVKQERAMQPLYRSKNGSVEVIATKNDLYVEGLIAMAKEKLKYKALYGRVLIIYKILQNEIISKTYSIGLSFFGSRAIEQAIAGDFKKAADALIHEFPLLGSISDLLKSKDKADRIGNSIKTLYNTYQTFRRYQEADNLKKFLKGEIKLNPRIRVGKSTTTQKWTQIAMPWLEAREIIIKSGKNKDVEMRGVQGKGEKLKVIAGKFINASAGYTDSSYCHKDMGVSLGYKFVGIDYAQMEQESRNYITSLLSIKGETYFKADDSINLEGVFLDTRKAIIEANILYLTGLKDREIHKHKSFSVGTDGLISGGLGNSRKEAVRGGKTGIKAEEIDFEKVKKIVKKDASFRDKNGEIKSSKISETYTEDVDKGYNISAAVYNAPFARSCSKLFGSKKNGSHDNNGSYNPGNNSKSNIMVQSQSNNKNSTNPIIGLLDVNYSKHEKRELNTATGKIVTKDSKSHYRVFTPLVNAKAFKKDIKETFSKPLNKTKKVEIKTKVNEEVSYVKENKDKSQNNNETLENSSGSSKKPIDKDTKKPGNKSNASNTLNNKKLTPPKNNKNKKEPVNGVGVKSKNIINRNELNNSDKNKQNLQVSLTKEEKKELQETLNNAGLHITAEEYLKNPDKYNKKPNAEYDFYFYRPMKKIFSGKTVSDQILSKDKNGVLRTKNTKDTKFEKNALKQEVKNLSQKGKSFNTNLKFEETLWNVQLGESGGSITPLTLYKDKNTRIGATIYDCGYIGTKAYFDNGLHASANASLQFGVNLIRLSGDDCKVDLNVFTYDSEFDIDGSISFTKLEGKIKGNISVDVVDVRANINKEFCLGKYCIALEGNLIAELGLGVEVDIERYKCKTKNIRVPRRKVNFKTPFNITHNLNLIPYVKNDVNNEQPKEAENSVQIVKAMSTVSGIALSYLDDAKKSKRLKIL